jgi:membrane protease YdiL (CAAX protease family)
MSTFAGTTVTRDGWAWTAWAVGALLLLPVLGDVADGVAYGVAVALAALVLAVVTRHPRPRDTDPHRLDLAVLALTYVVVVALMRLAFVGFGTDRVLGLFLCFAGALVVGSAVPMLYTSYATRRPLAWLGLRLDNWRPTLALALLLAGVQFALTLAHTDLPTAEDWVPLLVMALVVGVFESIFFRGFAQGVLESAFGREVGVAGAAVLYGAYHVGYGMGGRELVFLTGLGLVYAVAYALVRNLLVLWPLLTPLGSFYAQLENGDIELPWASILGFVDVLVLVVALGWLAQRHHARAVAHFRRGVPAA